MARTKQTARRASNAERRDAFKHFNPAKVPLAFDRENAAKLHMRADRLCGFAVPGDLKSATLCLERVIWAETPESTVNVVVNNDLHKLGTIKLLAKHAYGLKLTEEKQQAGMWSYTFEATAETAEKRAADVFNVLSEAGVWSDAEQN